MTQHYYSENPEAAHDEREVVFEIYDRQFRCVTDAGVFSREGLDMGTRVLLNALPTLGGRVLDLGCGWGAVGVAVGSRNPACEIVAADVNSRAVELARRNLLNARVAHAGVIQSDGLASVEGLFDVILLNPPIRAGKVVIYRLFAEARARLRENGALYIVIRKQQGAESAEKYLQTIFQTVERVARDKGYWVLRAQA